MVSRRNFIRNLGIAAGGILLAKPTQIISKNINVNTMNTKLKLTFKPYTLKLKHVFTIASNSRTTTPVMLTQIDYEGLTGYGEASMPPYLGENHDTAAKFLSKVNLEQFKDPFELETILKYVDNIDEGNPAAKASIDIALHDLIGKMMNQPLYNIWGYNPENTPNTTFTIGIDKPEVVREKVKEALGFKILKVKLGRGTDKEMIETVRSVTDVPIAVDVNQGWKDREEALDLIYWLKDRGVVFVEQPIPKERIDDMAWLTEHSPLPTMADESFQRLPDVIKSYGVYSGINIKLMKCTGLREAHRIAEVARSLGMKVMMGCMTETSCGISAASQLSTIVDWADLDGNLLINNDPFKGTLVVDGKITLTDKPGIGLSQV